MNKGPDFFWATKQVSSMLGDDFDYFDKVYKGRPFRRIASKAFVVPVDVTILAAAASLDALISPIRLTRKIVSHNSQRRARI